MGTTAKDGAAAAGNAVAENSAADQNDEAAPTMKGCRESGLFTTGDMARLTGSTLRTVRFYDQEGLISPAARSCGGHRVFDDSSLQRLQFILDMREAGMSLADIKHLFAMKKAAESAGQATEEMSEFLNHQVEEMQNKIAKLERLRSELGRMMESIRDCGTCNEPRFKKQCGSCSVMKQCGLPRAMKLLWK